MQPAKILIEHCFQNARAKKEVGYLFPVLQCLGTSVDPKGLHTDLGAETLERLKCLPVKNREYLIDHHNIAHSPEPRLDFWRSNKRPLYRCKDPILQLANDVKLHDLNEYFTGELWTITGQTPDDGNAGLLSFSVVFVFLHLLFEFRISKSICKFVTIIIHAFIKIRMFFILFAGGIISFTIAVLHLLHSCPFKMCVEPDPPTSFPTHFYGAISATFFYMGGRYNSVDKEFDSKNWAFQTLMITSYFFMVVLMLNVLIALVNNAFSDGEATWRMTWLDNRLRVIEAVENLSYHIPGLREHSNWFPDEIYYSVQGKQIEVYQAKDEEGLVKSTDSTDTIDSTDDRNGSNTTLANRVNSVSKMKNPFVQSPRNSFSSKIPSKQRSSFSPIMSPILRNSFGSMNTVIPDVDADGVVMFLERPIQDLKIELGHARQQILALQINIDNQEKSIATLQNQNMEILGHMEFIRMYMMASNVVSNSS
ncbi:hypothetical protein BG011_008263 [Mortierella polycephala]|uniref:Ion transport domain-containing protein n=1 Tax=Mortierella polycephala TaxID=41804 RepID=A0A9P6PQF2_9FUNG|nr:hypothetical protein BG011_008263 [Mortierella polycephala]